MIQARVRTHKHTRKVLVDESDCNHFGETRVGRSTFASAGVVG